MRSTKLELASIGAWVAGMASRIPKVTRKPVRRNPDLEARGIEGFPQ